MDSIVGAKGAFVKYGQVNESLVRREIAQSWQKCKMASMDLESDIVALGKPILLNESPFLDYLERIIPPYITFFVTDEHGNIFRKNVVDSEFNFADSISELAIGTSSLSVASRIKKSAEVKYHEHYLNILSTFVSHTIYVGDKKPLVTIFTRGKNDGYLVNGISNSIFNFGGRKEVGKSEPDFSVSLSTYVGENCYDSVLKDKIREILSMDLPPLIVGKDADKLAWYIVDTHFNRGNTRSGRFSPLGIPDELIEDRLVEFFEVFDAVIIADLDMAPRNMVSALSAMLEFHVKNVSQKYNIVYTLADEKFSNVITKKLSLSRLDLDNYMTREAQKKFASNIKIDKMAEIQKKEIIKALEATDWHVHEASKRLGLGRATLYRRIKEYQIEKSKTFSK